MALVSCPECNSEVSDKAPHCVKCGCPISSRTNRSSSVLLEHPPKDSTTQKTDDSRVPCPNCSELVKPSATLCPFCKQAILSKNKGTNAVANIALSIVIFLVLFYALNAFIQNEAERNVDRISRDAQKRTEEMMRNLQQR